MNLYFVLCILVYWNYVSCQSACNSHKSCGVCIGHEVERCVWCAEETDIQPKCQPEHFALKNEKWCRKEFIYNPQYNITYEQDDNFSSSIQFRPQKIKIKARPGVYVNFTMSYKPADDFPLDVYFVMDYSNTMKVHKDALQKQALNIYEGLKKLTDNVRLGVGSFVEKPGLPFADINKHETYAFKNHLSLTNDMKNFERVIRMSQFGSNYDDAEAGLDALMQAMTCENELGWRNESRRIIVLATDSTYHSAGDGKMIGAIKPNDMLCHLVDDEYNKTIALTHDYPSVSVINKVAGNRKFKIIFAAVSNMKDVYEALARQILGAKYAELKEDSNILQIIEAAYNESVKHIEIDSEAPSSIQMKIDQDCQTKPKVNCESSPLKPIVTIPVSIKSTDCPKPGDTEYLININPVGLNDKLRVIFEVDCQCECEKNGLSTPSKNCSNAGISQCGACKCNPNRGGDLCELNCTNKEAMDYRKCIEKDTTKVCNDHGNCRCGKCECELNFSGEFCQYDDTSCPSKNGLICAGNGKCHYAKCECKTHWIGSGCECPDNDKQCIGPFSAKVCSGRGTCDCGLCVCDKVGNTNETYLGAFCDSCDECAIERCEELKDYAYCNHENEKDICDNKFNPTAEIEVQVANKSELLNKTEWKMATKCRTELENGTFLVFKYKTGTRKLLLMIQKEVEFPPKANIWVAVGSAIAGILLIGLLTAIIWKVAIDIYDKKEYEKFCNEARGQGYDVSPLTNPLYKPPMQNFVNPGFNQNVH